jgi:peptidoglycan/LPS O-acetylase OafA/YrhL
MNAGHSALATTSLSERTSFIELRKAAARHLPALDGVRGVAILVVLWHRFNLYSTHTPLGRALDRGAALGYIGVQLFFVLSGFLITGILLDSQTAPNYLSSFFGRRVLRIFPLYYGTLFAGLVLLPLLSGGSSQAGEAPWLWLFLSNWPKDADHGFPHFWSLAVEEQFYFVWPFVVRTLGTRRLIRLCAALVVISFISRSASRALGVDPEQVYTWTICRMDALASGAAVAALVRSAEDYARLQRFWKPLVAGTLLLTLAVFVMTHGDERTRISTQTIGYTTLSITFAVLVAVLVRAEAKNSHGPLETIFRAAPLRTLGKYSYAAYVFHVPVHHLMVHYWPHANDADGLMPLRALAFAAIATLVTFCAAVASYHLFEKHFLALKKYFSVRTS